MVGLSNYHMLHGVQHHMISAYLLHQHTADVGTYMWRTSSSTFPCSVPVWDWLGTVGALCYDTYPAVKVVVVGAGTTRNTRISKKMCFTLISPRCVQHVYFSTGPYMRYTTLHALLMWHGVPTDMIFFRRCLVRGSWTHGRACVECRHAHPN